MELMGGCRYLETHQIFAKLFSNIVLTLATFIGRVFSTLYYLTTVGFYQTFILANQMAVISLHISLIASDID